mgnify:CR=1 FL=1
MLLKLYSWPCFWAKILDTIIFLQMRTRTREPKKRPQTIAVDIGELHLKTAHNYSIQTFNSTEHARDKLRQILNKVSNRLLYVASAKCTV